MYVRTLYNNVEHMYVQYIVYTHYNTVYLQLFCTFTYLHIHLHIHIHHSIYTTILSTKYIYTVHICTLYNNCSEYICFNNGALSNEIKFDKHRKKDLEMVKNITT